MSCVVCESDAVQLRPAVDVLVVPYSVSLISLNVLTLYLLMWRIWRATNNASKGQMRFNLAFKGLNCNFSKEQSMLSEDDRNM